MRLQRSREMVQGQANPAQVFGLYPSGSRAPSMVLEQNRNRSSTDVEEEGLDRGRLGGQSRGRCSFPGAGAGHLGSGECRQWLSFSTSKTPQLSTPALSTASALQGCAFPHIPTTEKGPTSLLVMRLEALEKSQTPLCPCQQPPQAMLRLRLSKRPWMPFLPISVPPRWAGSLVPGPQPCPHSPPPQPVYSPQSIQKVPLKGQCRFCDMN